ncbi:MAG: prolyl oligopeptidase family serine peptidase [Vicinamibacterales bacterium]
MRIRSRALFSVFVAALAIAPVRGQTPPAVTIEQLLSAPFASGLVAAPVGQKVAWVFDERGTRNVWIAEGPSFAGRALSRFSGDDGQEITSLRWTPDARHVVFVRGGGPNRAGELPNPTSNPESVDQAIWLAPAAGGEPRKIASGDAPSISPKGDLLAFTHRGQIWTAGVTGTPAPVQAVHARGSARGLRWSPDGTRIAFASNRGTHAFIGVFDLPSKSLQFVDASVDSDSDPVWSPDGREIAFVRRPVRRDLLPFHPEREGEPWSIRAVDATRGAAREIWRAERGKGSVFQSVNGDSLTWTVDNHLVFPWERDGWKHLYAVPGAGGSATLLTPGAFEVEDVTSASDRRSVLFSSNQDDIDRRHIWRVAVGSAPEALTRGTSIEWNPTPLGDGSGVAYLRADARRPGQPVVHTGGVARELSPDTIPSSFPAATLVEPEAVTFTAADGMSIPAQLFKPRMEGQSLSPGQSGPARHPAVIFFHGGSRRQMLLGWHYLSYYHNTYALNQYLASRGYLVFSVNYRSGTGYGLDFREALDYGAAGASEYQDVVGAGLYLRSRPDVDPARIGLWGGSYGGYLTAMGLSRAPELFAAGVDIHGVHDWTVVIGNFQPTFNPQAQQDVARRAFLSSPMASINGWRAPVLVVHGDDDRNVPFSETVDLVEQLRKRSVVVEQVIFPDEVHGFLLHRNWRRALSAAAEFFDRHLKVRNMTSQ